MSGGNNVEYKQIAKQHSQKWHNPKRMSSISTTHVHQNASRSNQLVLPEPRLILCNPNQRQALTSRSIAYQRRCLNNVF